MRLALAAAAIAALALPIDSTGAEDVLPAMAADEFVVIRDVAYENGAVSGIAENRSNVLLRDVKLRINCSWRWKDEFNPGEDDMSWGAVHELREIPPNGAARFRQESPRPIPERSDGRFHVEVTVAGLTRVRIVEELSEPAAGPAPTTGGGSFAPGDGGVSGGEP